MVDLPNGRRKCTEAGMLSFSEFVFENGDDWPLSASYHNIVQLQQGVPYHFSETRFCKYYPERGLPYGDRQSVYNLQWLAYIGRTRNNIVHAGNGREVHLAGVPNVKVVGYCAETNEVFEYIGCFWHGCFARPIDTNPLARLRNLCRTVWGN
jgi:hypothetical protein